MADRVAEAMQDLYAVEPDEFMATRSRLVADAKAASDKEAATEIGRLRKPSLAAWAVNLTAREAEDVVADLVDLGERMRSAQSRLDAAALTGMRKERDATVEVYVRAATRAVSDAGRSLSPAAQQEVRATAIAALADEQASAAVTSGQLTRSLSYSGFGEVDLAEALARTTGGAILTVVPGGRGPGPAGRSGGGGKAAGDEAGDEPVGDEPGHEPAGDEVAERRAEREAELAEAERRLADAERAVAAARERAEETRERLAVVERQLAKAREADERALEAVTDAVRDRKQAQAARDEARKALGEPD
ncbi:hypothetical protein RKE38_07865 [Phycicoccus sp. M110.8]|uniref:hypothetical protein n=1 Tax=Phycicoccus sp. M110.8 TaxID=3075433 RepID=UPI0028FD8397|nr:hypothetical protein [Phycicoccus sp. M110.8]MDU0313601.1 hypothetical protein [Phycicoccus sp. M110.8]